MADIVPAGVRSRMMAGIRGRDTKPELILRRGLHGLGFRYRVSPGNVPGKPDLVFPKYRAVLLVHGCFWHGHDCHLFRWPSSREEFWRAKIGRNRERDAEVRQQLVRDGWRVATVWECALKGRERLEPRAVIETVAAWLRGDGDLLEIRGVPA